jgi:4-diphosphocytidyl-2-C-methyl-D-erythritol kinase
MRVKQNCKINIGLQVLNKRTDGYHDLVSVFAPISLYDILCFRVISKEIKVKMRNIPQEQNIVYQTAKLIQQEYGVDKGIHIHIHKKIPIAAGLGGGSADAAMTIKMCSKLWKLNLSNEEMINIAEKIGSDVPFFVHNKLAIVRGRGEKIEKLDSAIELFILLVKPDFGFQTKEVFTHLIQEKGKNEIENVIIGFKENDFKKITKSIQNDLEKGILYDTEKAQEILKIKKELLEVGALNSSMSGSGSCVYGIFNNQVELKKARKKLNEKGYLKRQMFIVSSI